MTAASTAGRRIVLLTAHSHDGEVQHRYVAARIAEAFPEALRAIVVATGVPKTRARKARGWIRRYSPGQLVSRLVARAARRLARADDRRQRTFARILFPGGEDGTMPRPDLVVRVPSHNGAECLALLDRLSPDIVVVYGTMIIGRKVIDRARRIVNLHTGLSPRYRGSDTIFWPLHNGEPEHLGVTVHRVVPGVDAGAILARGRPRIEAADDEDMLFAKSVEIGADLLVAAIVRELDDAARPLEQDLTQGREYRSVDRTLFAERRTRRRLRDGLLNQGWDAWREEF